MKYMLLLALLSFPVSALELTYEGEWELDMLEPATVTTEAVQVSQYVSIIEHTHPIADAYDANGVKHCLFMVDLKRGIKAMISSRPMPWSEAALDIRRFREFVFEVYVEAGKSGGVERLSQMCGA